jgi:transposase
MALVPVQPTALSVAAPIPDVDTREQQLDTQRTQLREELEEQQRKIRETYRLLEEQEIVEKSLKHYKQATQGPEPLLPPSTQERKKFAPISSQVRALVVKNVYYDGSMSWEQAMLAYSVSRASISRILKEEKSRKDANTPKLPPKKRGRKSPLHMDALIYILFQLEANSTLSLAQLVVEVQARYNVETSTSAIDRALKQMDITWKNILSIPADWNTVDVIQQRREYVTQQLVPYMLRPFIYVDEQGYNLHIKRSKGRAVAGQPAKLTLLPKGQRISVIAALSKSGITHHQQVNSLGDKKRGITADDFRLFLLDLAQKIPRNAVLILDNAKIHHAERLDSTWTMLKETYAIDHLFLPPYSPFLNPIEYAFNVWKNAVRSAEFYNRGDLARVIDEKVSVITPENAEEFFKKTIEYHPQAALGLPFTGKPLEPTRLDGTTMQATTLQCN